MTNPTLIIKSGWPTHMKQMAAFLDDNMEFDHITETLLREKLYSDPDADQALCLSAWMGDELAGFLFAVKRDVRGQIIGYIKLMAVDRNFRRRKIGTQLYQKAEALLVEQGVHQFRIYDAPLNYLMPGIDPRYTPAVCFAWKMGFQQYGEAVNMRVSLLGQDFGTEAEESELRSQGVEVRRAGEADLPDLHDLLKTEWQLWNHEVHMAMQDNPSSVHIAFINGKLRAFSVHNGNNKGTGWFGPMGTHPDLRGKGIGSILLKRCLLDMQQQGYDEAIIPWVAPIAFYSHHVNAYIDRIFWRMEKKIAS